MIYEYTSLRKYFKTQLLALGVQADYVDYMMDHTVDTYNDIQSIEIDTLRNSTRPQDWQSERKQISKLDTIKEMIRALGENPEQLLSRDALAEGAITHREQGDFESYRYRSLEIN